MLDSYKIVTDLKRSRPELTYAELAKIAKVCRTTVDNILLEARLTHPRLPEKKRCMACISNVASVRVEFRRRRLKLCKKCGVIARMLRKIENKPPRVRLRCWACGCAFFREEYQIRWSRQTCSKKCATELMRAVRMERALVFWYQVHEGVTRGLNPAQLARLLGRAESSIRKSLRWHPPEELLEAA